MTDCTAPRHAEPEPAAPHAWLCRPCAAGLRRDLHRLPALYAGLGELLDPRRSGPGTGDGDGLPYHDPASECMSQIRRDLRFWANWIIEVRQPSAWPVPMVAAMAGWLAGHADWVPYWEHAGDMAGAMAADRGRAVALLDPHPSAAIAIPPGYRCPRCGVLGALSAVVYREDDRRPSMVTCGGCGHGWDATQWLRLGRDIMRATEGQAA